MLACCQAKQQEHCPDHNDHLPADCLQACHVQVMAQALAAATSTCRAGKHALPLAPVTWCYDSAMLAHQALTRM
jgi:hypothetical protein